LRQRQRGGGGSDGEEAADARPRSTGPARRSSEAANAATEAELRGKIQELEALDQNARFEEHRLRQEHTLAVGDLERARRREAKGQERVEDAKRLEIRSQVFHSSEIAELMHKIADMEQEEKRFLSKENAWKAESEALVLEQAKHIARRDDTIAEKDTFEANARADATKVAGAEARVKRMEEKVSKEKLRVDLLTRESEVMRSEAAHEASHDFQELEVLRRELALTEASAQRWCSASLGLGVAAVAAALWRATDPALW